MALEGVVFVLSTAFNRIIIRHNDYFSFKSILVFKNLFNYVSLVVVFKIEILCNQSATKFDQYGIIFRTIVVGLRHEMLMRSKKGSKNEFL